MEAAARDGFEGRFAAELEVLAELEGSAARSPAGRSPRTFAQAPGGPSGSPQDAAGKRPRSPEDPARGAPPSTPRLKRSRLQTAKKLSFEPEGVEEPPWPASPCPAITPPLSPEVPAELCGEGALDAGASGGVPGAAPAARHPVLRRPPVLDDYVSVTSTDGHRAFLVLRADPAGPGVQSPVLDGRWRVPGQLGLLGVPFASLKEQVDGPGGSGACWPGARAAPLPPLLPDAPQRWPEEAPGRWDAPPRPGAGEAAAAESEEADPSADPAWLWVDAFAPRCYAELLSDDFTNRCLLKWLKLWDPVVFGRERPAGRPRPGPEPTRAAKEALGAGRWKSREQVLEELLEAELDPSQRPRQKVALLCGPPGLGKTTLAHVIARHAGYCVVEMNASDDRSPEAFRTRIEAATQMESVLGAGGKPNCLVIDEIDGAPAAAISVLLSVLDRKGPQEPAPPAEGQGEGGRRRRAAGGLLRRPVICICNDQFAPALRPLKLQALVLHFPPTLPSRLVQRLQEISLRQGMRADPGALAALCEKADHDIRACVNALQFLHRRGQRELSVQAVRATCVGLKDQRRGLFSVWQDVFQLPRAQRRQDAALPAHALLGDAHPGAGPPGAQPPLTLAAQRFHQVLRAAASAGEHEKVVQGLFENFLRLPLRGSSLGAVGAALDWLAFDDLLQRAALRGQHFQLLRYPPVLPAAFHVLFAASRVPRLAFPSSQQEAQSRTSRTRNLIQTLVSGIAPAARSRAAPQALVLDTLCLLLDILSPKLRPVSTQLYSAREKEQLAGLVGTMLAYSLTYRQERAPDGQYTYRLEPDVEEVCRFPGLPARKPLSYQARQLIAREVELERMRRADAGAGRCLQVDAGPPAAEGPHGGAGEKGARPAAPRGRQQRLQRVLPRAALDEQPERDFFGRAVVGRAKAASAENAASDADAAGQRVGTAVGRSDVWFRFKEGVSNAVRRRVHIRDLL